MKTITAVTSDQKEFFRVVDWSYDQGDLSTILQTAVKHEAFQLKVTLADADPRLPALAHELESPDRWTVSLLPSPLL